VSGFHWSSFRVACSSSSSGGGGPVRILFVPQVRFVSRAEVRKNFKKFADEFRVFSVTGDILLTILLSLSLFFTSLVLHR